MGRYFIIWLFEIKQIPGWCMKNKGLKLFPVLILIEYVIPENNSDFFPISSVKETESLLAGISVYQVPFSDAATSKHLNGIDTAGVSLGHTDNIFIRRKGEEKFLPCRLGYLISYGKSGTCVTVKNHAPLPIAYGFTHGNALLFRT